MPRSVLNFVLVILVVTAGRAALAGIFFVVPSGIELVAISTAIAASTFLFKLLPEGARSWIEDHARSLVSSSVTTVFAASMLLVEVLLGAVLANVQISWEGPNDLVLSIQGQEQLLKGIRNSGTTVASRQARQIYFAFVPLTVRTGSFVQKIQPLPFRANSVNIPEYLAESSKSTELVESDFDNVFLQVSQTVFHERAQKRLAALRDKMGPAAAKRLQAISDLLEESYLHTSDASDKPRNLLLAYKMAYAGDPWIPALDASVALSERRYADAVETLSKVISRRSEWAAVTPSRASLSAMYAVSLTRLACDLRAEAVTRAKAGAQVGEL